MNIGEALHWARRELDGGESPQIDASVLLCHALQCNSTYLYTWPENDVPSECLQALQAMVTRRQKGEPVAYIVGFQEFWSLSIEVHRSTLIPRPETELLVELAITLFGEGEIECLDLGTGTGAVALALASEKPRWNILGVDKVSDAVELANRNKARLGFENVSFIRSDWFGSIPQQKFSLIVSNPPYVESNSEHLRKGDVRFEPTSALTSGLDGLDDIRIIAEASRQYLHEGGYLLLEHGYEQAQRIAQILQDMQYQNIQTRQDLAGLDRVTLAQI